MQRWLDAVGPTVRKFELLKPEPVSTTLTRYTVTVTGTSPVTNRTTEDGGLLFTTGGTEYNGCQIQALGALFKLETNKPLSFYAKGTMSEATNQDLLIGLCEIDTTLMATASAHAVTVTDDGLYFYKLDAVTDIVAAIEEGGNVTTLAIGTMDTSAHEYEFYWDGSTYVTAYFDGTEIGTLSGANLPAVALTPSVNTRAGSAAARTFNLTDFRVIQVG